MLKEQFLNSVQNWDNHRYLLWPALEATTGNVIEMGIGHGSTPFLHEYCNDNERNLYSYENDHNWWKEFMKYNYGKHIIKNIADWDQVYNTHRNDMPGVVLVDHAPGERRWLDISLFSKAAQIIVIHDSEPAATGYMLNKIWHLFKYRKDYITEGAWASAVSNFIDVSKFEL